jgi:hypothetical protein
VNPVKNLAARRVDLGLSELVWTTAHRIKVELQKWKNTIWSEICVSRLSNECENYSKEIHKTEKRARDWSVYNGFDTLIKSVSSVLPIMDQLQGRHWLQLEKVTGVNFEKSPDLGLQDTWRKI